MVFHPRALFYLTQGVDVLPHDFKAQSEKQDQTGHFRTSYLGNCHKDSCHHLHGLQALLLQAKALGHKTKNRIALLSGNPAISIRPVAFRPRLATGLVFSNVIIGA